MSNYKLEVLPNELLIQLLKKFSLYDRYYSFAGLNNRFNALVCSLTPEVIREEHIHYDPSLLRKPGAIIIYPHLANRPGGFIWQFIPVGQITQQTMLHPSVVNVCRKHEFRLNEYYPAFGTEQKIKSDHAAASSELRDEDERNRGKNRKKSVKQLQKECKDLKKELREFITCKPGEIVKQKKIIDINIQKIWTELRESKLLPFCID